MMFTFFLFVYSISTSRDGDCFRWQRVKSKHFPTVFKKIEKNKKKVTVKRELLGKLVFDFFYIVTTEILDLSKLKFITKLSISFPLNCYRDKSKCHYRKNVMSFLVESKYLKTQYKVLHNDSKIIRIHSHKFFLLLTVEMLTHHLRSESFFVYNDTFIPVIEFKFNTPILYNSDLHGN
ncbi:hypothetical protein AGLY_008812 [Aphis glycines]|uniref:Uncharacterized protein n=1 Tax=Aphis glycines TaxID=307491 RepID=A0A6G0TJL7_APHGL|nr:hypothetical protein AGLY_008812 [Aphis glycines]